MNQEKLTKFLKAYAGELRSAFDWKAEAPYAISVRMAAGCVRVINGPGEPIATFYTRGVTPSCPISNRDVRGAEILADVLNAIARSSDPGRGAA